MSLVHDALQKAEREKLRKTGEIAPVTGCSGGGGIAAAKSTAPPLATRKPLPQPTEKPPAQTQRRGALLPLLIATLIAIAVGVFVWAVLRPPPVSKGAVSSAPSAPAPATPVAAGPPAEPELPPAAANPAYKLTGVMKDPDGKPCAIVNSRVVSEGHYVDDATVKKIERDRVTLDVHGREVVLRLY